MTLTLELAAAKVSRNSMGSSGACWHVVEGDGRRKVYGLYRTCGIGKR